MQERFSPPPRKIRRGFLGMLESSKIVDNALNPDTNTTPQQREVIRLIALGKHFNRTVSAMKRNGSKVAEKIIEEEKAAKARRDRDATSDELSRGSY